MAYIKQRRCLRSDRDAPLRGQVSRGIALVEPAIDDTDTERALKIGRIEHRLDRDGVSYLTNDRLFVRSSPDGVEAVGIPKLPRINPPGTIVRNSRRRIGVS